MNNNKENPSESKYVLPNDIVSNIPPCDFIKNIYKDIVIDFHEMGNRVPEFIRVVKYDEINNYENIPIIDSYRMFIQSFNQLSREQILKPPKSIIDYFHYLSSNFPQKACFQIANSWPPVIPRVSKTIEPIIAVLIKILNECADSINFLRLLVHGLFPKIWTLKSCKRNPILLAISPCSYNGNSNHWAYIMKKTNEFFLVRTDGLSEEIIANGIVTKVAKSKDLTSVIVRGDRGKIACFKPDDPNMISIWTYLFKSETTSNEENEIQLQNLGRNVPFPFFLTSDAENYPQVFVNAFYSALTAKDLIMLRSCILMDPSYEIVDSLLTVFLHSRRSHLLFSNVVSILYEGSNFNPFEVFSRDSFFRKFVCALHYRFAEPYIRAFLIPLINFINRHDTLSDNLFFSVLKHIMLNGTHIPIQIRHFCSIIKSYSSVKYNSRGLVYLIIGGLFGLDFICPFLRDPTKYMPDIKIPNPMLLKTLSELLQYVFHGSVLPDRYSEWNPRLIRHTIPNLEQFLFSLSDIPSELPMYSTPGQDTTAQATTQIMHFMLKNGSIIRNVFEDSELPSITYPPQIGWNFATGISDFFRHSYDRSFVSKFKKHVTQTEQLPIALPKLPMYGVLSGKKAAKGNIMENESTELSDIVEAQELILQERSINNKSAFHLPSQPKKTDHNPREKQKKNFELLDQNIINDESDGDSTFTIIDDDVIPQETFIKSPPIRTRAIIPRDIPDFIEEENQDFPVPYSHSNSSINPVILGNYPNRLTIPKKKLQPLHEILDDENSTLTEDFTQDTISDTILNQDFDSVESLSDPEITPIVNSQPRRKRIRKHKQTNNDNDDTSVNGEIIKESIVTIGDRKYKERIHRRPKRVNNDSI